MTRGLVAIGMNLLAGSTDKSKQKVATVHPVTLDCSLAETLCNKREENFNKYKPNFIAAVEIEKTKIIITFGSKHIQKIQMIYHPETQGNLSFSVYICYDDVFDMVDDIYIPLGRINIHCF